MIESKVRLEGKNLWLNFGGIQALSDVSFQVPDRDITGIIGPNGSGKTCILNVVSGFYKPQKGKILFEGENLTGLPPHEVARLGLARSFQHMELFYGMTVFENLLVGCHPHVKGNIFSAGIYWGFIKKTELELRDYVEEVLEFMNLKKFYKHPTGSLPLGIQKLVGVARALCSKPKILLLDEPSSGLSHSEKEDIARTLLRIKYEKQIPILWVEHDIGLIGELADKVIALDHGKKIAEGEPGEVFNHPAVLVSYLGRKKSH